MITNITIEKVKGIENKTFNIEIKENMYNLLVAPNGFGKSSFFAAFDSLRASKMELKDSYAPIGGDTVSCKLSITDNGITYSADNTSNQLYAEYNIYCINCRLTPKAIGKNFNGHVAASGYLGIEHIELKKTPQNVSFGYKYSTMQSYLTKHKNLLKNLYSYFGNPYYTHMLVDCYPNFEKLLSKRRKEMIDNVLEKIYALHGTIQEIKDHFDESWLDNIKGEECYKAVVETIGRSYLELNTMSELDKFLFVFQMLELYERNKTIFKKAVNWADYEVLKSQLNNHIEMINTTGQNIVCKEDKGSLMLSFPKAHTISNGQRDVLVLSMMLKMAALKLTPSKKHIFIIDEVFDYLDDANILAAQYYISGIVNKALNENIIVYPIIMTHLSPERFKNYAFPDKKLNVQYLKETSCQPDANVKKLLAKRSDLTIKADVSHYLLHYATGEINKRNEFRVLGLKETWGEGMKFLEFIIHETNKYLAGDTDYDPYSVFTSLRIRIEKIVYDRIVDDEQKSKFETTKKTKEKLHYAEECGVQVEDVFYMLGILYNDVEHVWDNGIDKPAIYKLDNLAVRSIISQIFNYKGIPITIDSIH